MRMEHIALVTDVCKKGAKKPSVTQHPDSRFSKLAHSTANFVAPTLIDKKSNLLSFFFPARGPNYIYKLPIHRPWRPHIMNDRGNWGNRGNTTTNMILNSWNNDYYVGSS